MTWYSSALRGFRFLLACLIAVVFGVVLLGSKGMGGYRVESILSGSMAPALPVGGLAVIRQIPPSEYAVGDIVSFQLPVRPAQIVTHRVSRLFKGEDGILMAETKGDANPTTDQWTINLGSIRGKKVLVIPWLGYVATMVHTLSGFLAMAVVSFFLVVVPTVAGFIGETRRAVSGIPVI